MMRKTTAIYCKDLKDMLKNINAAIMFLLPLLFAVLYTQVMDIKSVMGSAYLLMMTVVMNMCMSPLSLLPMIIAEEKEKNTLRTLMLSNVSASEFIAGKVLAVYTVMELVNVLLFFIIGLPVSQLPAFILITTLGSICLLIIGAVFGLISRDQMSTSMYSVSAMLFFLFPALLQSMNSFFGLLAKIVPTTVIFDLFNYMTLGNAQLLDWVKGIGIVLAWTGIALAFFVIVYRKKGVDN